MSTHFNTTFPDEIRAELDKVVDAVPQAELLEFAAHSKPFAQGFRPTAANAKHFRQRLHGMLDKPDAIPTEIIGLLRQNSLYQTFTCVLSTNALTHGYDALAALLGEAPLLAAMLLDERREIVQAALEIIKNGIKGAVVAESPEERRKIMDVMFSPFLQTLETILFAPAPVEQKTAPVENPAQTKHIAKLENELQRAKDRAATLEKKFAETKALSEKLKSELAAHTKDTATRIAQLEKQHAADIAQRQKTVSALEENLTQKNIKLDALESINEKLRSDIAHLHRTNAQSSSTAAAVPPPAPAAPPRIRHKEFLEILDETLPQKTTQTKRDRIAELTHRRFDERDKIVFFLDGHNILNTAEKYKAHLNAGTHEQSRDALCHDVAAFSTKIENCEFHIYFDGPEYGERPRSSSIKIVFSGGEGKNRADDKIIDYLVFRKLQDKPETYILISEDRELRDRAHAEGNALAIHPGDFVALMA